MHTPEKNAPQSARRSSKQHAKLGTDNHQSVQSDNDAYLATPQEGDKTPSRKTRKARKQSNARRNGVQSDIGEFQEQENHLAGHAGKLKNTPAKAIRSDAYAGPTFHQSPAASAIPMPSFMPRSLPNSSAVGTAAKSTDGSSDVKQPAVPQLEEKRETTPLDWMFHAARQARGTPNDASPARIVSPQNQSPAPSPGARKEETDFPFELDGTDDNTSAYSTPFNQRLAASKTPQSGAEDSQAMTEEERQAKTAALKKALMNNAQLGSPFNDNNPFNARNAPPGNVFPPRHASNPTTPAYHNGFAGGANNPYFPQYNSTSPSRSITTQATNRPPSSNLRNMYDPSSGVPSFSPPIAEQRISTAKPSAPPQRQLNFGAIYGQPRPASEGNPTGHNQKPSLERGLDDLRKVLNLTHLGPT